MQADLKTAVDAAMYEWHSLPRWKRLEMEREMQLTFVHRKVFDLVLRYKQCGVCLGGGRVAGPNEYEIITCYGCNGEREVAVHPTLDEVRGLVDEPRG